MDVGLDQPTGLTVVPGQWHEEGGKARFEEHPVGCVLVGSLDGVKVGDTTGWRVGPTSGATGLPVRLGTPFIAFLVGFFALKTLIEATS